MHKKRIIAGVDEAGRGCVAGPLFAAAVILPKDFPREVLADSKVLNQKKREEAFLLIQRHAAWGVGEVSVVEVDELRVKGATRLAMLRAIQKLAIRPDELLVDGDDGFEFDLPSRDIIDGDVYIPEISAASIVAKVLRDHCMDELARKYPDYLLHFNKGYGTLEHLRIIQKLGHSEIHRKSYEPLRTWLVQGRLF